MTSPLPSSDDARFYPCSSLTRLEDIFRLNWPQKATSIDQSPAVEYTISGQAPNRGSKLLTWAQVRRKAAAYSTIGALEVLLNLLLKVLSRMLLNLLLRVPYKFILFLGPQLSLMKSQAISQHCPLKSLRHLIAHGSSHTNPYHRRVSSFTCLILQNNQDPQHYPTPSYNLLKCILMRMEMVIS